MPASCVKDSGTIQRLSAGSACCLSFGANWPGRALCWAIVISAAQCGSATAFAYPILVTRKSLRDGRGMTLFEATTRSRTRRLRSWRCFAGIGGCRANKLHYSLPGVFSNSLESTRQGPFSLTRGYRALAGSGHSPRALRLSEMQFDLLTPWSSVRHDYFTFELAMEHLRTAKPRVIYIALGETDDWAHERRYDRVLETAEYFDKCLRELWATLQSMPQYKDKTSLVVTTDHGRGSTLEDWTGHGSSVEGAEFIWIAAMGPDTAASRSSASQRTIFSARCRADVASARGHRLPRTRGRRGETDFRDCRRNPTPRCARAKTTPALE